MELLAQAGVSQEALYRGQASDNLSDVVFQVASNAKVGHTDHTAHTFDIGKFDLDTASMLMPVLALLSTFSYKRHYINDDDDSTAAWFSDPRELYRAT